MYCERCGKTIEDGAAFCEFCGTPHDETPAPKRFHPLPLIIAIAVTLTVVAVMVITLNMQSDPNEQPPEDSVAGDVIAAQNAAAVPSLDGMTEEEATAALEAVELTANIAYSYDDTIAEGVVISQSPAAETQLSKGDGVTVTVSLGRDPVCPYEYTQKVVVSAAQGSSSAMLTLYEWQDGDWAQKFTCTAKVGENGIGAGYGEGRRMTPQGTFKLGVALAAGSINNADWPIYHVSANTCVVDDTSSPLYNTIQNISSVPYGVSYDAIGQTIVNGYSEVCIYIEHNGDGFSNHGVVPGKGSLITLCGRNNTLKATAGCVDITAGDMRSLLTYLDYAQNPHIEMSVGGE